MSSCFSFWFNRAFHTSVWVTLFSKKMEYQYTFIEIIWQTEGYPLHLFFYYILHINCYFHLWTINMHFHFRCQCPTYKNAQKGQTSSDRYTLRPFYSVKFIQQRLLSTINTDWQPVILNISILMNQILLHITLHLHRQHRKSKTLRASIRHIYDWCG